ncbi:hypothetical protein F441_15296 [Phytophthora nicotianae CJ01A1]|uniref:Integrase catalytic domain-containing protein n=1 Tax=Phytophthora nicotianae CJ01A1 TaxID=1317063 RepID=W2WEK3_PHYNI|nr:hypothetical protein F441_15296 [Phytophthora nicotianae CJ01A1]
MATTAKKAEAILGSDNYFHWEFAMRMTLTKKGQLAHVQVVRDPAEVTEAWMQNDTKALGLIAQGMAVEHHTKIRSAMQAWTTLRDFYKRTTMHNGVTMTRRLHEFKMEEGSTMAQHLDRFDELIVGLQTLGDPLDGSSQLVILISSLPVEYELIAEIVENSRKVTLIKVKEKLLKEYERQQKKESTERALKASFRRRGNNGRFGSRGRGLVGHMKRDCPDGTHGDINENSVFAVGKNRSAGSLIESGATAHMTPYRNDIYEYQDVSVGMYVTVAEGKKIKVTGTGSVRLTGLDGKRIKMVDRGSCIIWNKTRAIASGRKSGKAYVLDCEQDAAYYTEYSNVGGEWELWHARMGHLHEDSLTKTQQATKVVPTSTRHGAKMLGGGCMKGKQTVARFPSQSLMRTRCPLEPVHTDVIRTMKTKFKGGARYVLTFVDYYSRHVVAYFMSKNSEVSSKFESFLKMYKKQWGGRMKCLRSGNGTEFVNKAMDKICQQNGILHQKTVSYSPEQNGGVSTEWWAEALSTAVYLTNRSTNSLHPTRTLYDLVYQSRPRLDHLRVFGSMGYAHVDKSKRTKLEPKSFKCLFLGYADDSKGYRVFDLESNKVKMSRSVRLEEREVDGIYDTTPNEDSVTILVSKDDDVAAIPDANEHSTEDVPMEIPERDVEEADMPEADMPGDELTTYRGLGRPMSESMVFRPEPRRAQRAREPVLLLVDDSTNDDKSKVNGDDDPNNDDHFWPPFPKRPRVDEDCLLAEASSEASQWVKATNAELKAHADNGSWTLDRRSTSARPIGCRWGFAKKRDEHGRIFGVDFFETYSPVANMNSIRVVLAVVVAKAYVTEQLDADTAFLQLDKAIYGLKQAASAWHKTIHRVFMKIGFRSCGADECVYVKANQGSLVYVCLYVDDMIIAARTREETQDVKTALKNAFKMKELGEAKFILGMEINHDYSSKTLMIKQTRYIDDVVERFKQKDAKVVVNPCESGLKLTSAQSPTAQAERMEMQRKLYRALIGCLLYITTCTRPDVAYIVTQLSRFLENPGQQHWKAAIRVLRYLKGTRELGIVYSGTSSGVKLTAYTDADWGSNPDDRRSVSGTMVTISGAPVIFKSKYQRTVALSSAEAEYMALGLCTQEGAIALAINAGYNARTNPVDIKHHFIRENVARGIIQIKYVANEDELADMLTKASETKRLKYRLSASGVRIKASEH